MTSSHSVSKAVSFRLVPDDEAWDSFPVPTQLRQFSDITLIKYIRVLGRGNHAVVFEVSVGPKRYALKLVRALSATDV
jgi:hypothetical protein